MDIAKHADLVTAFTHAFEDATGHPAAPEVETEVVFDRPSGPAHLDVLLRVQSPNGELQIAAETLSTGYPRDVRQAVWVLEQYQRAQADKECVPMVIAQYLSPGARTALREQGIGFYDGSGNLYIRYASSLIDIERPSKERPPRNMVSLFSGAREQVVHCMLQTTRWQGDRWFGGAEIAAQSQTSSFTVSQTMRELEQLEWVESKGAGPTLRRRLLRPGKLLDAWAEAWRVRKVQSTSWYLYTAKPQLLPLTISEKLEKSSLSGWALTGIAAANALAPLLTSVQTADLIIPPGATSQYADALSLKPASSGVNITLIERGGAAALFRDTHPEYPTTFASPFIQYLDLQDGRGRNKELATHLRETVLKI